jgi:oxygen-independent coproporphyrinogen-3 oxidase
MENKLIDSKKGLGLYIHIPFCVKKCEYCDFLSGPASEETKRLYVEALIKEIFSNKDLAAEYLVKTIFIGGGYSFFY